MQENGAVWHFMYFEMLSAEDDIFVINLGYSNICAVIEEGA